MNSAAESAVATHEHAALARDLLQRAVSAFASVPSGEREAALSALDRFLENPGPASYLAAVRVLTEARHLWSLRQARLSRAGYARARGLDTVRRELGAELADTLAAVPADDRTGLRLRALALLAAAHRELAGRVAGSTALLRKQMELAKSAPAAAPPRRRPAPRLDRRRGS